MNFPVKIDLKIRFKLETDMRKLFKIKKRVTNIRAPKVQIILTKTPFLEYEQFQLAKNFRQYVETIMPSSNILRMGIKKTPYQKTCEIQATLQDFTVGFLGCNKKFDWLKNLSCLR